PAGRPPGGPPPPGALRADHPQWRPGPADVGGRRAQFRDLARLRRRTHHLDALAAQPRQAAAPAGGHETGRWRVLALNGPSRPPRPKETSMTRFAIQRHYAAMQPLTTIIQNVHKAGRLEQALIELVLMRCSQINGCAYCLDMHGKDARAAGETEQ